MYFQEASAPLTSIVFIGHESVDRSIRDLDVVSLFLISFVDSSFIRLIGLKLDKLKRSCSM